MERFRLLKYGTHGTVRFGSLASMALIDIMACSLSITRGYFALRMAGMSCTHCLKSSLCVFALELAFMDQEHCRDDRH